MRRRALCIVVIVAAASASAAAAAARPDPSQHNAFIILFPAELLAVLVGGGVAGAALVEQGERAAAPAVGLYLLAVGAAVGTAFPIWLPGDNTILGAALLAGLLSGVGAGIAVAGAAGLAGAPAGSRDAAGLAGGTLAFLAVAAGGMVAPLARWHTPLVVAALVAAGVLPTLRRRRLLAGPLALAAAGAAGTVAALLLRGPGDWASASASVKLYSAPIVAIAGAVSLLIADSARPDPAPAPRPA